jgi:hypothetical protein
MRYGFSNVFDGVTWNAARSRIPWRDDPSCHRTRVALDNSFTVNVSRAPTRLAPHQPQGGRSAWRSRWSYWRRRMGRDRRPEARGADRPGALSAHHRALVGVFTRGQSSLHVMFLVVTRRGQTPMRNERCTLMCSATDDRRAAPIEVNRHEQANHPRFVSCVCRMVHQPYASEVSVFRDRLLASECVRNRVTSSGRSAATSRTSVVTSVEHA